MAILNPNMVMASSNIADLLAVGGTGVQIGNVVRDTATSGNWTAPFITAGQHLTTLAELAGKSLAKTSAAFAVADFGLNLIELQKDLDRIGKAEDRTMLNLATSISGLVAAGAVLTTAPAWLPIAATAASISLGVAALTSDISDDSKTEIVGALSNGLVGLGEAGVNLKSSMEQLGSDFSDGVNNMMNAVDDSLVYANDKLTDLGDSLRGKAAEYINEAQLVGDKLMERTWQEVNEAINKVDAAKNTAEEFLNTAADTLSEKINNLIRDFFTG